MIDAETQTAFVSVVDAQGCSHGQVFGPTATKCGDGWTFTEASLHGILGALTPERSLAIELTSKAGKRTKLPLSQATIEGEVVTITPNKA